jgi:Txe/YoeB family toxin of toxin-antitoxin system
MLSLMKQFPESGIASHFQAKSGRPQGVLTESIAESGRQDARSRPFPRSATLVGDNRRGRQCARTPFAGTGKPEPLRGPLSGWWSRQIKLERRLVYKSAHDGLLIAQCRYRY